MYYLQKYQKICELYEKAAGHPIEEFDSEESSFFYEMGQNYYDLTMQNADAHALSREKAEELTSNYFHLIMKLSGPLSKSREGAEILRQMKKEYEDMTFLDTDRNMSFTALLNDVSSHHESEIDIPRSSYMSQYEDRRETQNQRELDLADDAGFLPALTDHLNMAKQHVHGSSHKFDEMETALNDFKNLAEMIHRGGHFTPDSFQEYIQKLRDLKRKADAYEAYKTKHNQPGCYDRLKTKEKIRVNFARAIQAFAGSRIHRFECNQKRFEFLREMERKAKEEEQNKQKENRKDYSVQMKHFAADVDHYLSFTDANGQFSAEKMFNDSVLQPLTAIRMDNRHPEEACNIMLCQTVKTLFGNVTADDHILAKADPFLKSGTLDLEDVDSCREIARRAVARHAVYRSAGNNAIEALARRLSSMSALSGSFVLISGLMQTLLHDPETDPTNKEPMSSFISEQNVQIANGAACISSLMQKGTEAWKQLCRCPAEKPADFEDRLLDYTVLKAIEINMKRFSKNSRNKDTVNPIYALFGSNPACAENLKKNIRKSPAFRKLLNEPSDSIREMMKTADSEAVFIRILAEAPCTKLDSAGSDHQVRASENHETVSTQNNRLCRNKFHPQDQHGTVSADNPSLAKPVLAVSCA